MLFGMEIPNRKGFGGEGGIGQCNVTYRKNVALRCGCSVPMAEWLDLSAVGIAQIAHAAGESILPWGVATRLFPNDYDEDMLESVYKLTYINSIMALILCSIQRLNITLGILPGHCVHGCSSRVPPVPLLSDNNNNNTWTVNNCISLTLHTAWLTWPQ